MELREYLQILLKRAWLILPLTFLSLVAALWFSYQQTPVYEATSTYVTRLGGTLATAESDTLIYGIETLAGGERISITYCQVFTSQSVRERAFELMGLNPKLKEFEKYEISCANLPETNVLVVTVQGNSPTLVTQLNQAVGLAGMERANTIYSSFPVESLDPAELEKDPISPQTTRNGVLGGLLGLVVGVTLALTFEYLRAPSERLEAAAIRNLQVGTYNERYFRQRFEEEMNRPYARLRPLSLALMRVTPNEEFGLLPEAAQSALRRSVSLAIQDTMRQRTDIITYVEPWAFAILLTETSGDEARNIIQRLHSEIRAQTFEHSGYVATFGTSSGVVSSSGDALSYREMMEKSQEALAVAEAQGENTIYVLATTPRPFVEGGEAVPGLAAPGASGSVFNVTEADLFGNADVDAGQWQAGLDDLSEDNPTPGASGPSTAEGSRRARPRNSLLARAMQQQELHDDSTPETDGENATSPPKDEPEDGR